MAAGAQPTSSSATAVAPAGEVPFPVEARIAFVDFGRVAAMSKEGKALAAKIQELRATKESEVQSKGKEVAALEAKLIQAESVLNDAAREQLRKQFERAQIDFQRLTQDAQTALAQVQRELEQAFLQKAFPVIGAIAQEKRLWAVLSVGESGLVWREPTIDISDEIARRIDAPAP
jgi:Skp family chaperone for outer membrane proteins